MTTLFFSMSWNAGVSIPVVTILSILARSRASLPLSPPRSTRRVSTALASNGKKKLSVGNSTGTIVSQPVGRAQGVCEQQSRGGKRKAHGLCEAPHAKTDEGKSMLLMKKYLRSTDDGIAKRSMKLFKAISMAPSR